MSWQDILKTRKHFVMTKGTFQGQLILSWQKDTRATLIFADLLREKAFCHSKREVVIAEDIQGTSLLSDQNILSHDKTM